MGTQKRFGTRAERVASFAVFAVLTRTEAVKKKPFFFGFGPKEKGFLV